MATYKRRLLSREPDRCGGGDEQKDDSRKYPPLETESTSGHCFGEEETSNGKERLAEANLTKGGPEREGQSRRRDRETCSRDPDALRTRNKGPLDVR